MKTQSLGVSMTLTVLLIVATIPVPATSSPIFELAKVTAPLVGLVAERAAKRMGSIRSSDVNGDDNDDDDDSGETKMTGAELVAFADNDGNGKLTLAELITKLKASGTNLPIEAEKSIPFLDAELSAEDLDWLLESFGAIFGGK